MKILIVSQKTFLARRFEWRHFRFVWYRVQRAGTDWQELVVQSRGKSIDEIQDSLERAGH